MNTQTLSHTNGSPTYKHRYTNHPIMDTSVHMSTHNMLKTNPFL